MEDYYISVDIEREKQETKWGEQNHNPPVWLAILAEEVGELATAILNNKFGGLRHDRRQDIIDNELVQIGAVCKAMWECSKRNHWEITYIVRTREC